MHVRNTSTHAVDLDSGRCLVPGESADTDESARTTELLDAGLLGVVEDAAPAPVPAAAAPAVAPTPPPVTANDAPGGVVTAPAAAAADTKKEN